MQRGLSNWLPRRMVNRPIVALSVLLAVCVLGGFTGGCQSPAKDAVAQPANDDTVRLIRQYYTAADPKAIVGLVIAVLPDQMYAAVGDVDVKDFSEGDAVSFIDSNKNFLVFGVVKKVTADALDIHYEAPTATTRAPKIGDLAVRFKP